MAGRRPRGIDSVKRLVRIDGKAVEPARGDIVETEPGAYSILIDGRAYEARVSGDTIVVNGHPFVFEVEDPRAWKRTGGSGGAHGRASITAPMPGKVVRVLATAGEQVEAGQGIAIAVRENDSVNAGAVLATIE